MKKVNNIQKFLNDCSTYCHPWSCGKKFAKIFGIKDKKDWTPKVIFQWSKAGRGFGEFAFYHKDKKIYCYNELMSKEFIKEMLCKMVDDCILMEK